MIVEEDAGHVQLLRVVFTKHVYSTSASNATAGEKPRVELGPGEKKNYTEQRNLFDTTLCS